MMLSFPISWRKYSPGLAIRSSRPTQIQRWRKICSISWARIAGEVKYSRGRVWAPAMGISVGLMKVVTGPARGSEDAEICRPPFPGGRRARPDLGYIQRVIGMLERRRKG